MFNKKYLFSLAVLFSIFFTTSFPAIVDATGLVPCGTKANPERCTICHLFILANNIIRKLRDWIFITSVVIIAIAGVIYIVSVGNESMTSMAKTAIKSALIGAVIILVAWLAIFTIMMAMAVTPGSLHSGGVGLYRNVGGGGFLQFEFKCQ